MSTSASTQLLTMLADKTLELSNDDYDVIERDTRAALIAMFTRGGCVLGFCEDEARHNYATDDRCLYLGTHECGDRKSDDCDDIYVELWAWIDDTDGTDEVFWNLVTLEDEKYFVRYCPFCGVDLQEFLTDD